MTVDRNNSIVSTSSNANLAPVVVDYNISQITPYVFVTAEDTARQFPKVFSNGINCVINVAHELPYIVFPPSSRIESLKYPIEDTPTFPAAQYFDAIADRIAHNVATNRRTLLYCHHGRSRSVTFILAYLIKHHNLPLPAAFALVKERRQLALPNVGFWSQLKSFESYHQQQQQKANDSVILKTLQHSVTYGEQMLHKMTDGVERVLAQVPFVNTLTDIQSNFPKYYQPHPSWIYAQPDQHHHNRYYRLLAGLFQRI